MGCNTKPIPVFQGSVHCYNVADEGVRITIHKSEPDRFLSIRLEPNEVLPVLQQLLEAMQERFLAKESSLMDLCLSIPRSVEQNAQAIEVDKLHYPLDPEFGRGGRQVIGKVDDYANWPADVIDDKRDAPDPVPELTQPEGLSEYERNR